MSTYRSPGQPPPHHEAPKPTTVTDDGIVIDSDGTVVQVGTTEPDGDAVELCATGLAVLTPAQAREVAALLLTAAKAAEGRVGM